MKHKLLTLASAAALLAACSDTSVSDANDEIKEKSTVTFFVYDVLTRMPLEDVANYYRTDDKTKYTDSTGTIVWKNVELGDSYFDFQKEGYAMKRVNVGLTDDIKHDVSRVRDTTTKVEMYELGVDVKGQFFYVDPETKNWIPAPNATVYVDYPDDSEIYPNEVYTKTDSNGFYSFKNLAANIGFEVRTERFTVDSVVYEVDSIGATAQRKGVLKEMDPLAAVVASLDPKMVSSNLNAINVKDEIKLNFTEVLEKDSVTTKYIKVKRVIDPTDADNDGKPDVLKDVSVSVSLSEDGKTITIKSTSGEWADGKQYIVEFDVWSTLAKNLKDEVVIDGITYKKFRKFTAGSVELPGQVKNLVIDLNDDKDETEKVNYLYEGTFTAEKDDLTYNEVITIKWDGIEKGVDSYNVYVKGDIDAFADYKFVDNYTDTTVTLNLADLFNDGNFLAFPASKKQPKVISVIVLPVNAAGEALAKNAKALEIKTFEKADDDVYAKQTNMFNVNAKVTLNALYECGTDGSSCTPVAKGSDLTGGDYYSADLTVAVSKTDPDWNGKTPTGYQLYYNGVLVADQASPSFTITHGVKMGAAADVDMPYTKAQKYKASDVKSYDFVIVPYFSDGVCSDDSYKTKTTCEGAYEVWTEVYKIGQTELDQKNALSANDDVQDLIDDL